VATALNDLPDVMKSVRTMPMFAIRLDVRPLLIVGATPGAYRRVGVVPGGSFEGERLPAQCWTGPATGRRSVMMAAPHSMFGLSLRQRTAL
jgi:hypothetical protein